MTNSTGETGSWNDERKAVEKRNTVREPGLKVRWSMSLCNPRRTYPTVFQRWLRDISFDHIAFELRQAYALPVRDLHELALIHPCGGRLIM